MAGKGIQKKALWLVGGGRQIGSLNQIRTKKSDFEKRWKKRRGRCGRKMERREEVEGDGGGVKGRLMCGVDGQRLMINQREEGKEGREERRKKESQSVCLSVVGVGSGVGYALTLSHSHCAHTHKHTHTTHTTLLQIHRERTRADEAVSCCPLCSVFPFSFFPTHPVHTIQAPSYASPPPPRARKKKAPKAKKNLFNITVNTMIGWDETNVQIRVVGITLIAHGGENSFMNDSIRLNSPLPIASFQVRCTSR